MKNKQIFAILMVGTLISALTGCVGVNINNGKDTITGEGNVISRTYDVESFDSVQIDGDYELIYRNGESSNVELEMQENLFEYVNVSVKNGKLLIDSTKNIRRGNGQSSVIRITSPELSQLIIHGGIKMTDADIIAGEKFDVDVSGACSMDIALDVESVNVSISGAGMLQLQGSAKNAKFDLSGTGSIEALDLNTLVADVIMSGAAKGSISCSEKLNVEISGTGSFQYKGNPQITKDISGLGAVTQVNK